jgi:RNase P subunit RPR2
MYDILEADEERVISIADVRPRRRCPKCASLALRPEATPITETSFIGASLYDLTQTCMMCGWSRTFENVKLGV